MELLEQKIIENGIVIGSDILKVDMFLNHQIDIELLNGMGEEFYRLFHFENVNKIVTVEASGIGIACIAAQYFKVPVVFAKKADSRNLDRDVYQSTVYSFTKEREYTIRISEKYLSNSDRVLIVDDFLANGRAALGLIDIIEQAGGIVCGVGVAIEKGYQGGRALIEEKGIRVEALANIDSMSETEGIRFKRR